MRSCLSAIIPSLTAALLLTAPAFAAPAQPAKEAAVPVQTAATSSYSGNAKTRIFHVSGCRYFNCKACTVRFKSAEEARSNGYKPCKRCLARADHVSPLPQTCQRGPSLQSLSCVSPCSRPLPAQLAYGAGLSPQRPVSLRKTVTESRHPSLGPSDPEGSGVPSFLSLQLFSDRSAS